MTGLAAVDLGVTAASGASSTTAKPSGKINLTGTPLRIKTSIKILTFTRYVLETIDFQDYLTFDHVFNHFPWFSF